MEIKRKCRRMPLKKQPLALVLIQIRFSPIENIKEYINLIQDKLRIIGYPEYNNQDNINFVVSPMGVKQEIKPLWIFSTIEGYSNILIDSNQILFQTTEYTTFENFYEEFNRIIEILFDNTNFIKTGRFVRFGLRYIDQIIPKNQEDSIDSYLHKGMTIQQPEIFSNAIKTCNTSIAGKIRILNDTRDGFLVIKTIQGEKGLFLPPDLLARAPTLKKKPPIEQDIGIIDMDASFNPLPDEKSTLDDIKRIFYSLHDVIIETFFSNVASEEGVKKWN